MDVLEAIRTRRSIGKVRPERPPRELIEQLVEAAALPPNHYLTEPWRFIVLAGSAREELGQALAVSLAARTGDKLSGAALEGLLAAERTKPLRAPVLIAVAAQHSDHPKAMHIEDIQAVAAGIENLLLAANALGLGAYWRTGEAVYDPAVKSFFGLRPEDHLAGLVYVGYPDGPPKPVKRSGIERRVEWRGWDDNG